jgi:hypothetical protein
MAGAPIAEHIGERRVWLDPSAAALLREEGAD